MKLNVYKVLISLLAFPLVFLQAVLVVTASKLYQSQQKKSSQKQT